jgi:TrmH family RNA methyltransferase
LKITSINNTLVKDTVKLYDRSAREASGLFLIEGYREYQLAVQAGIKVETLFLCPDIFPDQPNQDYIEVAPKVFERLTYRGSSGGLLAVCRQPKIKLDDIKNKTNQNLLIVVLDRIEKPGNTGAIMRTADAAGVDGVIVCDEITDIYNPNTVRASLGGLFTTKVVPCKSKEALAWIKGKNISIVASIPNADKSYTKTDLKKPVALIIGSEKDGLSEIWLKAADEKSGIPMQGSVDSLNASVSAALLIYEAARQRSI